MQTGWRRSAPHRRPHHTAKLRARSTTSTPSRRRRIAVKNSNRAMRLKARIA